MTQRKSGEQNVHNGSLTAQADPIFFFQRTACRTPQPTGGHLGHRHIAAPQTSAYPHIRIFTA